MKNKYGYLLVFLCVGALLSCHSRHSSEKENEKKILVNVHFEQERDLQEEKLPLDVLKPSSMISLDSF